MANQFKGIWLAIVLVAAGVVIFFLTMSQNKPQTSGVELKEIFKQEAPETAVGQTIPASTEVKADPVPSPAIVADTDFGKSTGFAVQVYSFQDKNRAHVALESLKKNGYEAYMIISDLGEKGTFYRVRIGGLNDEAAAHATLEKIRKDYNSGFIVKPVPVVK